MRETVIVYTPAELPSPLTEGLPPEAAVRDCVFFIARPGPSVISELMEALPEPDIDHVREGMQVSERVLRAAGGGGKLAEWLGLSEGDEEPGPKGVYGAGFHTGAATDVRQFLAAHADLLSLGDVMAPLCVQRLQDPQGQPQSVALTEAGDPLLAASPGLFVFARSTLPRTVHGLGGSATVVAPAQGWWQEATLRPSGPAAVLPEQPVDQSSARLLIAEVFGALPVSWTVEEALYQATLVVTDGTSQEGSLVAMLVTRGGLLDTVMIMPVPLVPEAPVPVARYRALLVAARDALGQGVVVDPSVRDLLDIDLLSVPQLVTVADFAAVLMRPDAIAKRLAPAVVARQYPQAAELSPDQAQALYQLHPVQVVHRPRLSPTADSLARLDDGHLELVVEAWVEHILVARPGLAEEPVYLDLVDAIRQRIGDRVQVAAQRARERVAGS